MSTTDKSDDLGHLHEGGWGDLIRKSNDIPTIEQTAARKYAAPEPPAFPAEGVVALGWAHPYDSDDPDGLFSQGGMLIVFQDKAVAKRIARDREIFPVYLGTPPADLAAIVAERDALKAENLRATEMFEECARQAEVDQDALRTRAEAAEAALAAIDDMLSDGQGDDDGSAILPEFEEGMTTLAKVEACLHLLERRRDALIPAPSGKGGR